jgi:D-xylose 1-dehydrogenase (NADP+, D-xylono-1,5-lactone-forming)
MTLRLALLSTADINEKLAAGARQAEDVEIVSIGSRDPNRARKQAGELNVPRALSSYEEVLADPGVDAVYIPLPNSLHVEWSVRALEAGKHVLCEKPLSRHPAEVERAFDAAEKAGRVLAEAFMWRHTPQARRLRELAADLGEIRLVRTSFSFPLPVEENVRWDAGLDGGALMDVGCYCVSGARFLLGEPAEVTAQAFGDGVDARMVGTMSFASGALAHFDCGFDLAFRDELEVVSTSGALFVDDPWHSRRTGIEVSDADGETTPVAVPEADPYGCELEDFARACAGKIEHPFGRADAVGQARAIAALYEAADSGRAVAL